MGSSQTRARTCVPYIGRQILNHCATREIPCPHFSTSSPAGCPLCTTTAPPDSFSTLPVWLGLRAAPPGAQGWTEEAGRSGASGRLPLRAAPRPPPAFTGSANTTAEFRPGCGCCPGRALLGAARCLYPAHSSAAHFCLLVAKPTSPEVSVINDWVFFFTHLGSAGWEPRRGKEGKVVSAPRCPGPQLGRVEG